MPSRKKARSLFRTILVPQFLVMMLMVLIMTVSIPISGLGDKITRNYRNVVALQTIHHGDSLMSHMTDSRAAMTSLANEVTHTVQRQIDSGKITAKEIDHNPEFYEQFLLEVQEDLVTLVSSNYVSGTYLVLNTEDLEYTSGRVELPALYIRDTDPSTVRRLNDDLRVMRAPDKVAYEMLLVKDESWQPTLGFENGEDQAYFYEPLQRARHANRNGYWTEQPYRLEGTDQYAFSYSIPLTLDDGTVFGVLGVELLMDHISQYLLTGQLLESAESTYLLACVTGNDLSTFTLVANGGERFFGGEPGEILALTQLQIGGYGLMYSGREFFAETFELTSNGARTSGQNIRWYLVGIVGMNEMFSFANEMTQVFVLVLLLTLLVGIVSVTTVSYRLARPISTLSQEVQEARRTKESDEQFTDTGIEEIDRLASAFRELMQETLDASTKFLHIMDMASVELAGYEWREGSDSFFVTDNFFPMLGMNDVDVSALTTAEFAEIVGGIRERLGASITLDGSRIYCINRNGAVRYVRAESAQVDDRHVGLLEDVTRTTMERIRIEHERDYDVLTGLYNRRAFFNRASQLFAGREELQHSALLVLDADNLKKVNDRYGHDYGDKYLRRIAQCIMENTPGSTLCARISGDEMYVLLYGYQEHENLRIAIVTLMNAIRSASLPLPNDENMELSVSGGIAEYPEDSRSLSELVKYADFAMYQAKNSKKGYVLGFNPEEYAKNQVFLRGRGELRQMIEQENVRYHFQPIFSAQTAKPAAYEALMRVDMPSIKSPDVVMRLAAAEGAQYHIERITMFKASEAYRELLKKGQASEEAMLFINSLPDQYLNQKDAADYHERFADLQSRIVLEITEDEYLGLEALDEKRGYPGFSGNFALDDYGSGYNGEMNLLLLKPRFVKVDVVFIRGIDSNPDRQQLVSSLVTYAHGHDMKVVAEGIETAEELQKVLELGVDLFQGYFLARPAAVPAEIAPHAEEIILKYNQTRGKNK